MAKHVTIRIAGKVQGVFFRASALDRARELGLRGFVRNEPDGAVYAEAEGEDHRVEQFIAWCHQGPDRAKVETVVVQETDWAGFEGFEVRR
jgi:acylphosphatase